MTTNYPLDGGAIMIHSHHILADIFQTVFEEDGKEADPAPADPASVDPASDDPTPKVGDDNGKGGTFTQAQVNEMMAKDRRKHQEQTKKAMAEVEALRSKARLTTEERDDLDKRMQELQDQLLTKEELAKKEQERLRKDHENKLKEVASERDSWKNRYTDSAIVRSITDAAGKHDAYRPQQIVALLQSKTRLAEVRDDEGNPTGNFKPEIRFDDVDKEGKPVTLTLTPDEAVKRMREMEDYLNLFKGEGVGGLGQNNQIGGKKLDAKELAQDAATYRKARAEGKLKY